MFKISQIVKFGKEHGYIVADIQLSRMAYREHFKDVYTEDEIRRLLARPKTEKFNEYRTWVIVSVFWGTGIRFLELHSIFCKDVNLNKRYITLIHTKNKEPRIIPFSESLIVILQEYMMVRNGAGEDYIIYGDMMGRATLQSNLVSICNRWISNACSATTSPGMAGFLGLPLGRGMIPASNFRCLARFRSSSFFTTYLSLKA